MNTPATLLHLCTRAEWRAALSTGVVAPPSLSEVGFVHLSTPEQVALPATRLFPDRRDLLLLAVDQASLAASGIEMRWEPGLPGDPDTMRFPHAYGPVPTSAVVAVQTYRPRPDGRFDDPPAPPDRADHAGRLRAFAESLPRRLATTEIPVSGGVALLQAKLPWSRALNQLLLDDPTSGAEVIAEADRVLGRAGRPHRCVTLRGPDPGPVADELRRHGWWVRREAVLARELGRDPADRCPDHRVEPAELADVRPLWTSAWRAEPRDHGRRPPDRFPLDDTALDVRYVAVRDEHGTVVAAAALQIDGATAVLDAVASDGAHRREEHAEALLRGAAAIAGHAGCDLLGLDALVADWPRHGYPRRGFSAVAETWTAGRAG
ncbi:DUF952 domain-containing protein [Pseudonocardia asaccharolytica]|uniref:DUF952 domain-containing protein n=1 Tax=Pseudonocardia asaccharolytica TaxID=54010 RepID=UPI00041B7FE9|nr:DUF952 domain-containing protein [Pseudonocardia asaccharolytica]